VCSYLSGGIIITAAAEKKCGFFGGLMLCAVLCNLIKFNAIAVQQKLFGEFMGKCGQGLSERVRCLVPGVYSMICRGQVKILA
jgi:hypothetical protein